MSKTTHGIPVSKETLIEFFKLMGMDLECMLCTIEGRAKIHDIVYLAEINGIDLGYQFTWYNCNRG